MPSSAASFCCPAASNWCATCPTVAAWSAKALLRAWIVVRRAGDDRRLLEVVARRRRWDLPFESGRAPRVRRRRRAIAERPEEVRHREQIAGAQDRRAGGRQHVQHLELVRVRPVAAGTPAGTEDPPPEQRHVASPEKDHTRAGAPAVPPHPRPRPPTTTTGPPQTG